MKRYEQEIYYTQIGKSTCISVNPNGTNDMTKRLYETDYMEMYRTNTNQWHRQRPHIFAVANLAYRTIFEQNADCSIIVTGKC